MSSLGAQETELLDVVFPRNSPNPSSKPSGFFSVGSKVFTTTATGIFRMDASGRLDGLAADIIAVEAEVVGNELLVTDRSGRVHVLDTNGGVRTLVAAGVQWMKAVKNQVFFSSVDSSGAEPWVYDAVNGVRRLVDVNPGADSSNPRGFTDLGGQVYFVAEDGSTGAELWRTDGTAAGTTRVLDLLPGAQGAGIEYLTASASKIWFFAQRVAGRSELFVSDGTAVGTKALILADPDASLARYGAGVAFVKLSNFRSLQFASDAGGLGANVLLPGVGGGSPTTIRPIAAGGQLYFALSSGVGNTLWRSDGTVSGTLQLSPYVDHLEPGGSLARLGSEVLFAGGVGSVNGCELWGTDGTIAGTRELVDIHPNGSSVPRVLTTLGNRVWFSSSDAIHGVEPWSSDGTASGTKLVANLANYSVGYPQLVVEDGLGWFIEESPTHGTLWQTRGTAGATSMRIPILTGFNSRSLHAAMGKAFFVADRPNSGGTRDLMVSDGTAAGTLVIASSVGFALDFADLGDAVVFNGGEFGTELWRTDGTPAGTVRLGTHSVSGARLLRKFICVGTRAYYPGDAQQLTVTDGTAAGTQIVGAVAGVPMGSAAVVLEDRIAFVSPSSDLWVTDGTAAGTTSNSLSGRSARQVWLVANSQGFFASAIDDRFTGDLYFASLGGGAPIRIAEGVTEVNRFVILDDRLLFLRSTPAEGQEPWVSDGTAGGTLLLRDIQPGPGGSRALGIRVGSRYAYFAATSDLRTELWRTDGTTSGTVPVGSERLAALSMAQLDGKLLFFGEDQVLGPQLFAVKLWANTQSIGGACAAGAEVPALRVSDPVLGQALQMELSSPHGQSPAALVLGAPQSGGVALRVPGGCRFAFDPQGPIRVQFRRTDASGYARALLQIPANPVLSGLRLVCQAAVGSTTNAPLGSDLTAGVLLSVER